MTITSGSSAHFRGLATQAFFEDVLQKTCRLSTKLLIDSQKACSWHLYASNNLSVHLDQQWDLIKRTEKNARDFERMSMQTPEVKLAYKLRQQLKHLKQPPTGIPPEQAPATAPPVTAADTSSTPLPLPASSSQGAASNSEPMPPSITSIPEPPANTQPPMSSTSTTETPSPQQPQPPQVSTPAVQSLDQTSVRCTATSNDESCRVLRKDLSRGLVEIVTSSGELLWAPLEAGHGSHAKARLPNGQLLDTQVPALLLACGDKLSRKRTGPEMAQAAKRLQSMEACNIPCTLICRSLSRLMADMPGFGNHATIWQSCQIIVT